MDISPDKQNVEFFQIQPIILIFTSGNISGMIYPLKGF
jgi:hypothetical protein